ncbi:unnamed protein product [Sphagnum balticum]
MGCFPGRTFLVGASVTGKQAMMATHEPYSSGVIITTSVSSKSVHDLNGKSRLKNESHLRFQPINKPSHHPIPRVQSYRPTYGILMMSRGLDVESCKFKRAKTTPISHFVDKGSWLGSLHSYGILN